jgi:site-specific DNA-methyltransferase (adenine-specific)
MSPLLFLKSEHAQINPEPWPPAGPKPYYLDDSVCLFLGDCLEILPRLEIQQGFVITDPPYNAGKNFGKGTNDRQEWPEWAAWLDARMEAWAAVAAESMVFMSQTAHRQYARHGRATPDWDCIWHKPLAMAVCAAPFMPHWEFISYFGQRKKGQQRHSDGKFVKHKDGGFGGDVFTANVEYGKKRWGNHKTPKPLALMRDLVSRMDRGATIIDPFAGSGTTLRAAKDLGYRAVGIEIEERFCATIAERMAEERMPFAMPKRAFPVVPTQEMAL